MEATAALVERIAAATLDALEAASIDVGGRACRRGLRARGVLPVEHDVRRCYRPAPEPVAPSPASAEPRRR